MLHGVPGVVADVKVDGASTDQDVAAGAVVGPLDLAAGRHTVSLVADGGSAVTGAVGPGKSRLAVALTAQVPPADIRVDAEPLLRDVANAEVLTVEVPQRSYSLDIVPTGTSGPSVLGPVDLAVEAGNLTRVFAFGNPATGTSSAPARMVVPAPIGTAGVPTSQRRPFVPVSVTLPSGARAADLFGGVVIAGHVDSAEQGVGVMAELVGAAVGAQVVLEGGGKRRTYRIDSLEQVPKTRLSADLGVFDQVTAERLVLITCGGKFDPVARSYADNLVVIASPVEL